jgi:hypothetical protein
MTAELFRRFRVEGGSFGPADPVTNEQFSKGGTCLGEHRLMLAVLEDAVECFQKYALAQYLWEKKLFQEAEDWIFEKNSGWPFSFENICANLELNPGYIRRGLLVWKQSKRKTYSAQADVEHISFHKSMSISSAALGLSKTKVGRVPAGSG